MSGYNVKVPLSHVDSSPDASGNYSMTYWYNDVTFMGCVINLGAIHEHEDIIMLSPLVRRSKVILDVGAHCGTYSTAFLAINPDVVVYAFEPQIKMVEMLAKNAADNGFEDRLKMTQAAVGHVYDRKVTLAKTPAIGINMGMAAEYGTDYPQNLGTLALGLGGEEVDMITLDEYFRDKTVPSVDLIKIDVEGAETMVLMGARETIEKFQPVIHFEFNNPEPIKKDFAESVGDPNVSNDTIPFPTDYLTDIGYTVVQNILNAGNYIAYPPGCDWRAEQVLAVGR